MKSYIKKILPESIYNLVKEIYFQIISIDVTLRSKKFIIHNQTMWKDYAMNESEAEVLFEFTTMQTSIISYSYFANVLARKYNAKVKAYAIGEGGTVPRLLKKIYASFNADVFSYSLNQNQMLELEKLYRKVYSEIQSKNDVLNLTISDVWIGDLLYDWHLRTHKVPTVVVKDPILKESLKEILYQYIYWRDYFCKHNVKAINVTHCGSSMAIPMRIAIQHGIPAYQCNIHGCSYLTSDRLWAYNYKDYPKEFIKLPEEERTKGLQIAKERIELRFSGEVGVDMQYSTKSAYTNYRSDRVLSNNNKTKILIATHCFFDLPHSLGVMLFPDTYEWLIFLGKISEKTDYDWYIKTHPDFIPGNIPIIEKLITKYPKIKLIPAETSHHQIIEEGIDFALTVQGTIGWEYAALGKIVVNASLVNPHIAYNFNIHPKNIDEYERILMHLPGQKLDIDINEVHEYYYMKMRLENMANWLFHDYDSLLKDIGGYKNQFTSISYQKFLEEFSAKKHERIIHLLNNFSDSGDYCMLQKHMLVA